MHFRNTHDTTNICLCLGGFTTFSAFSLETIRLLERQQVTTAIVYVLTSVLGGLLAVALAFYLTRLMFLHR